MSDNNGTESNLKELLSHGLAAMKAGSDVAAQATDEISNDATHPALKAALEEANRTSKEWAQRIDRACQAAGNGADNHDNPVLQAHYEVSRRIRQHAPDDTSRDLGIIANGQMALHYWIAAFGTMANYTQHAGLGEVAGDMKASADEARKADQAHTELAERILADA